MHSLTDQQLADALLSIALAIPTDVPFNVLRPAGLPLVILWDCRSESNAAILEAVAQGHGEVVATSLSHRDLSGRQAVAAMIRTPEGRNPDHVAGELRLAYSLASAEDDAGDQPDPF